eukprot:1280263-Amphidinium_carterae.1
MMTRKGEIHVHNTSENAIAMMGKMNIKLHTPTQFGGKNPQFNEWVVGRKGQGLPHNPQRALRGLHGRVHQIG